MQELRINRDNHVEYYSFFGWKRPTLEEIENMSTEQREAYSKLVMLTLTNEPEKIKID